MRFLLSFIKIAELKLRGVVSHFHTVNKFSCVHYLNFGADVLCGVCSFIDVPRAFPQLLFQLWSQLPAWFVVFSMDAILLLLVCCIDPLRTIILVVSAYFGIIMGFYVLGVLYQHSPSLDEFWA